VKLRKNDWWHNYMVDKSFSIELVHK
jgi:hypothetical protein